MSHHRLSASRVVDKSTGGTPQSFPEPVDPVGNPSDCLTSQTVAPPTSAAPRQWARAMSIHDGRGTNSLPKKEIPHEHS
jgi:hypothetical protein